MYYSVNVEHLFNLVIVGTSNTLLGSFNKYIMKAQVQFFGSLFFSMNQNFIFLDVQFLHHV